MPRHPDIPPESFNEILAWLDPDRELAAGIYLDLRRDLVRIFNWNRCADPEGMADETLDRVARQIQRLRSTYEGNPKLFFYAVANNLIKEYQRKIKSHVPIEEIDVPDNSPEIDDEEDAETREDCLRHCLQQITSEKRELVAAYYAKEKHAKITHRTGIARKLGVSIQNLRVRMCRIRADLMDCIERCLDRVKSGK